MESRDAAKQREAVAPPFASPAPAVTAPLLGWQTAMALGWAGTASTLHRIRRGEGVLLAVNLSLLVQQGLTFGAAVPGAVVSLMAIVLMYAFNDLYDAPTDSNNPKKDRALIATYLEHRRASLVTIAVAKGLTLVFAAATLDPRAVIAVAAAMVVNVVYSTVLKGVPVVDVAWCGLWGALYAAIVSPSPDLWVLVGLMTAICHLYQALDDRAADAANAITTTAVRSRTLSTVVLATLSVLLFATLRPTFGDAGALSAFMPLGIYFLCGSPRAGWLLTKGYFAVMWLTVLGLARATG
jgi:4-hydroxybenzoate polyprenyltransferase